MTTTPTTSAQPVEAIPAMTLRDYSPPQALIALINTAGSPAASGDLTSGEGASTGRRNE